MGGLAIAAAYLGKEILSMRSLNQVEAKLKNMTLAVEFHNIYGYPPNEYMNDNDLKNHIIANTAYHKF